MKARYCISFVHSKYYLHSTFCNHLAVCDILCYNWPCCKRPDCTHWWMSSRLVVSLVTTWKLKYLELLPTSWFVMHRWFVKESPVIIQYSFLHTYISRRFKGYLFRHWYYAPSNEIFSICRVWNFAFIYIRNSGQLICPEGCVLSLNKSNPVQYFSSLRIFIRIWWSYWCIHLYAYTFYYSQLNLWFLVLQLRPPHSLQWALKLSPLMLYAFKWQDRNWHQSL